jgi:hypothetical protein
VALDDRRCCLYGRERTRKAPFFILTVSMFILLLLLLFILF